MSPAVPDFDDPPSLLQNEPFRRQLELFKQEVRQQFPVPQIRNNLKFYSAIPLEKLSQLTQKDGDDPHFAYGREQVYPGGNFDYHLRPFQAAFDAGASR